VHENEFLQIVEALLGSQMHVLLLVD